MNNLAHNYKFHWLTMFLMVLSLIGVALPGISIGGVTLFPFRLLLPLYILAFLILFLINNELEIYFPRLYIPLLLFFVYGFVNSLVGNPTNILYREIGLLLINTVIFIAVSLILANRRSLYHSWLILGGLSILALAMGSFEIITGWHISYSQMAGVPDDASFSTMATAWYQGVNTLALFLSLCSIYWFVMMIRPRVSLSRRIMYFVPWSACAVSNILLNARSGLLTVIVACTSALLLMYHPELFHYSSKLSSRICTAIAGGIGTSFILIFTVLPNIFTPQSSLWTRWQLQRAAIEQGGVLGNGFGSASVVLDHSTIIPPNKVDPHSLFGSIVAEVGLFGLMLFLIFYVFLLSELINFSINRDPVYIMCSALIISLPIATLGPGNSFYLRHFWMFLGLANAGYISFYLSDY